MAETLQEFIWRVAALRSPTNSKAALQQALIKAGYVPYAPEFWAEFEGAKYAIQPGIYWSGEHRSVAYCKVPEWDKVQVVTGPGVGDSPTRFTLANPLQGLAMRINYDNNDWRAPRLYNGVARLHEGIDLAATQGSRGVNILATADGVIDFIGRDTSKGYGNYVRLRHLHGVDVYRTWYAHLASIREGLVVGQVVQEGTILGVAGSTGNSTGIHLHFSLEWIGHRAVGNFIPGDWVDPRPYLGMTATAPQAVTIDLLPYLRGDGRMYEVRHPSGQTETFQCETQGNEFWLVKNSQYESFYYDNEYIWRGIDTSPGPAPDYAERPGVNRYYRQFEPGVLMARWCKRYMAVGETWTGTGHSVQFYYKDNCAPSAANSGSATNKVTLVARHEAKAWGNIVVNDVVELKNNTGETFFFGRNYGLCAWRSSWGESAIAEILQGRPPLQREIIPCL